MDEIILTDKGKLLLKYMQSHDEVLVGKDLIDFTGIKGIYPVLRSLVSKKLVEECEPVTRNFTNIKGETKPKEYKTSRLTDFGRKFSIED